MTQASAFSTPWGRVTITASTKGITAIDLGSGALVTHHGLPGDDIAASLLKEAQAQLVAYFEGRRCEFTFPVDWSAGTSFQRKVWKAIMRIPYGRVRSYQWVALRLGGKQYARAVGMALGANPVPIVVPCHRVIAHDGSLGGFSGGLPMKRRLLRLEGTLAQLRNAR
jgi:O-6-methylguanine DNA methyltransferase